MPGPGSAVDTPFRRHWTHHSASRPATGQTPLPGLPLAQTGEAPHHPPPERNRHPLPLPAPLATPDSFLARPPPDPRRGAGSLPSGLLRRGSLESHKPCSRRSIKPRYGHHQGTEAFVRGESLVRFVFVHRSDRRWRGPARGRTDPPRGVVGRRRRMGLRLRGLGQLQRRRLAVARGQRAQRPGREPDGSARGRLRLLDVPRPRRRRVDPAPPRRRGPRLRGHGPQRRASGRPQHRGDHHDARLLLPAREVAAERRPAHQRRRRPPAAVGLRPARHPLRRRRLEHAPSLRLPPRGDRGHRRGRLRHAAGPEPDLLLP